MEAREREKLFFSSSEDPLVALKRTYLAEQNILRDQAEKKGIKTGFESSNLD